MIGLGELAESRAHRRNRRRIVTKSRARRRYADRGWRVDARVPTLGGVLARRLASAPPNCLSPGETPTAGGFGPLPLAWPRPLLFWFRPFSPAWRNGRAAPIFCEGEPMAEVH